jgi:4'-phosphopantetheinyl transferase
MHTNSSRVGIDPSSQAPQIDVRLRQVSVSEDFVTVVVHRTAPADGAALVGLLDADELTRVAALRDEAVRLRAITARALLRVVCGTAFGVAPQDVTFTYRCAVCGGPHGKPRPVAPPGQDELFTSVSRAADVVVVAATHATSVGIDVEQCTRTTFAGFDEIALTALEKVAIAALPAAQRPGARAAAWVRKEALLKLPGIGLSREPSGVDVSDDVVRLTGVTARLTDVVLGRGYRACVATAGRRRAVVTISDAGPALEAAAAPARTATA